MTTTYTDALTDDQCVEICQRLPLGCAGFVSVEAIRYALAPLLTERQAAMQGQGGEIPDNAEMDRCEKMLTACVCIPDFKDRNMIDPQCAACELGDEVIETFRKMRAALEHFAATPQEKQS